jgi:hypothetical protein
MTLAVRGLIWGGAGPLAAARAGTATFDELVALFAAAIAFALLAWVAVALVTTTLAAWPGAFGFAWARLAGRVAPGFAGRLARLVLGLSLTAGPVSACTPALAGGTGQPADVIAAESTGDSGLPGVGRIGEVIEQPTVEATSPAGTEPPLPGVPPPTPTSPAGLVTGSSRGSDPAGEVVVRRGDTLWAIAARQLGPDATAADVAEEWPRWYAANRPVIGDNPDLILPGTILRPPNLR